MLVSGADCGHDGSQGLSEHLADGDICITFQKVLPTPQPNQVAMQLECEPLDNLGWSAVRVVLAFLPDLALHDFFHEVLCRNFTA